MNPNPQHDHGRHDGSIRTAPYPEHLPGRESMHWLRTAKDTIIGTNLSSHHWGGDIPRISLERLHTSRDVKAIPLDHVFA